MFTHFTRLLSNAHGPTDIGSYNHSLSILTLISNAEHTGLFWKLTLQLRGTKTQALFVRVLVTQKFYEYRSRENDLCGVGGLWIWIVRMGNKR